jgi:hypothetical protein
MSATADATQLAIERALDHVGITDPDEREDFADKYYQGDVSEFEEAAVRTEFAKVTRADIGREPLADTREHVLDVVAERILESWNPQSWQSLDNTEPVL